MLTEIDAGNRRDGVTGRVKQMRFVVRKNAAGKFWWRIVGGNNEIMAASELMDRKQSCLDAIAVVKRDAATAKVDDMTHETKERGAV